MENFGIYKVTNTKTKKFYIGSSKNIEKRWKYHKKRLKGNYHENSRWQNAWNKYGEDCWIWEIIEELNTNEELFERETFYLQQTRCFDKKIGYNISDNAFSPMRGKKHSKEIREKMSRNRKGKKKGPFTEEHRLAISEGWKLRRLKPVSEETKAKLSKAKKGKKRSIEFVIKIRGQKRTEESRNKMKARYAIMKQHVTNEDISDYYKMGGKLKGAPMISFIFKLKYNKDVY